jgi:hypothetical protein
VEEDGVKSALEIAMERLSRLPELTSEEIAEQKEKEYRPVGEAIGHRYLQDMISERVLLSEWSQNRGEAGLVVRGALVSTLCASIQLADLHAAEKALTGLLALAEGKPDFRADARSRWERLLHGFESRMAETAREFEAAARDDFADLGISGSAVRPNLRENDSFQKESDMIRRSFEPALEEFRSMAAENLQSD